MVDSVDIALDGDADVESGDGESYACASDGGRSKQKQKHDGESNGGTDSDCEQNSISSDSDEELREAELKLQLMKKQQKVLEKQNKRDRIARETAELEQSLKCLSLKNDALKPKKKKVTAASLRSMRDVVREVDQLMEKNMRIGKADESSSEEVESDVISTKGASSGRKEKWKK